MPCGMGRVARYGKAVAREGRGEALAELLLAAAADLEGDPGCELYVVNRQVGEPDVIWVTELWRSQDDSTPLWRRSGEATRSPRSWSS
jgi:quinol monooxygenase YgiN